MIKENKDLTIISFVQSKSATTNKSYKGYALWEVQDNKTIKGLETIIKEVKPDIIHAHSQKDIICQIGHKLNIPVVVTSHHGGILCPAGSLLDCADQICKRSTNHKDCLPCVLRNTRTGLKYWHPLMRNIPEEKYIKLGRFLKNKPFIPFITPIGIAAFGINEKKRYWLDVAEKCSAMVAPCNAIADVMIKNGLNQNKLRIIPHGIPLPSVRPEYPDIVGEKIKFYYVGRISYVKGLHVMLEAFSKVPDTGIELHIIGDAANKGERLYKGQLQRKYKNDGRIIWHGKKKPEEIYEVSKDFHVSISPSIFLEVFGLNIAEALALGKPVIATRSGGGEMQITDGVNGWLVPPNDSDKLAEKIIEVINHRNNLKEMSANCHAISIEEHCGQLIKLYKEVIADEKSID